MNELTLRPRSATELVDAAFQVFRRNPVPFMLAGAVVQIPWFAVSAFLKPIAASASEVNPAIVFVSSAIGLVVYTIASALVMLLARDAYLDRMLSVGEAFRGVTRNLIPFILGTFAVGVLLFLTWMVAAIPLAVLAPLVAVLGGGVTTAALIIVIVVMAFAWIVFATLYVLALLFAVRAVILLEGAGVGAAFSRSAQLSRESKLHIVGALLLAWLLMLVVMLGASGVIYLLRSTAFAFLVGALMAVFVYPFVSILEVLLYYDMRIRKEGFDIEYLSGIGAPAEVGGPAL